MFQFKTSYNSVILNDLLFTSHHLACTTNTTQSNICVILCHYNICQCHCQMPPQHHQLSITDSYIQTYMHTPQPPTSVTIHQTKRLVTLIKVLNIWVMLITDPRCPTYLRLLMEMVLEQEHHNSSTDKPRILVSPQPEAY